VPRPGDLGRARPFGSFRPLAEGTVTRENAARACRALAYQEEQAAKRMENPGMRGPVENTARRAAVLAEKFERARPNRSG